jgi:ATP-dependent RNA helicase DeaD
LGIPARSAPVLFAKSVETQVIQTLSDALQERGYETLTPVQEAVTAPELEGADMLVSAQTGSGKTVGFGLAIAPTLLQADGHFEGAAAPLALVIAPTRELALQVKRELSWLYAKAGVVMASCVGGMDMRDERRALERGAHIVVATPGRLRDHIMRGSLDMGNIRAVVLDEADEMLDLGFREDLEFILGEAPQDRRTLMFSATVPKSIATLAKTYQKDAVRVQTVAEQSQHSDIEYLAMNVALRDVENAIINVLRYYEAPNALVFCNTRAMVNRLTTRFSNRGFSVVALSGELTQNERTHALQAMRDGRARVCIATDVAARGIDLPNLELVIHAELPTSFETLLHRSGRTGRAGRKGVSALIVPAKLRNKAQRLMKMAKINAEWVSAPSAEAVQARDAERLLGDPVWEIPVEESEQAFVSELVSRYDAEQIAAAYIRLFAARQSAPEELADPGSAPEPRPSEAFGPSVWFSVSGGRDQNAEPRRLLPMLCKAGGITKDDIGAIRIRQTESFVEIKAARADAFAARAGTTVEDGAVLTRLASAPDLGGGPSRDGGGKKPRDARPPREAREKMPARPRPERSRPEGVVSEHKPRQKPDRPQPERPKKDRKPRAEAMEKRAPASKPAHKPAKAEASKPAPAAAPAAPAPKPKRPKFDASDPSKRIERPGKPNAGKAGARPGKPKGKPGAKPFGKPAGKPAGKSGGKPAGKPGGKPSGYKGGPPRRK